MSISPPVILTCYVYHSMPFDYTQEKKNPSILAVFVCLNWNSYFEWNENPTRPHWFFSILINQAGQRKHIPTTVPMSVPLTLRQCHNAWWNHTVCLALSYTKPRHYLCATTPNRWSSFWLVSCSSDLLHTQPGKGLAKKFSSVLGDSPTCLR